MIMVPLKRLKVFRFALFQALLMGLLGLCAGILYSFGGLLLDALVSMGWVEYNETPGLSHGTILAFGAFQENRTYQDTKCNLVYSLGFDFYHYLR